jgi:hypothetical protein
MVLDDRSIAILNWVEQSKTKDFFNYFMNKYNFPLLKWQYKMLLNLKLKKLFIELNFTRFNIAPLLLKLQIPISVLLDLRQNVVHFVKKCFSCPTESFFLKIYAIQSWFESFRSIDQPQRDRQVDKVSGHQNLLNLFWPIWSFSSTSFAEKT